MDIACGISGQLQHTIGMQESSIIVSINTDPDAPINAIADYVITGRVEEVLPKMIKKTLPNPPYKGGGSSQMKTIKKE